VTKHIGRPPSRKRQKDCSIDVHCATQHVAGETTLVEAGRTGLPVNRRALTATLQVGSTIIKSRSVAAGSAPWDVAGNAFVS
jgi:hypothetical protein